MPLVPLKIVSQWYQPSSWVYKNFKFLFVNPLYDIGLPAGFSLCPYFWLALFSFFFYKPIIGFVLILRFFVRLFKLERLLNITDKFFVKLFNVTDVCAILPTVLGILLTALIGSIAFIAFAMIYLIIIEYYHANCLIVSFICPTALFISLVASEKYIQNHDNSDRCKVEYYVRGLTISSLIYAIFFNWDNFYYIISETFKSIFISIPTSLFHAIMWLLHDLYYITIGQLVIWLGMTAGAATVSFIALLLFIPFSMLLGFVLDKLLPAPLTTIPKIDKNIYNDILEYFYYFTTLSTKKISYLMREEIEDLILRKGEAFDKNDIRILYDTMCVKLGRMRDDEEAAKKSRNELCKKITAALAKFLVPIGWIFKQIGILFCLLWELIKARKQGVCPYLRFKE